MERKDWLELDLTQDLLNHMKNEMNDIAVYMGDGYSLSLDSVERTSLLTAKFVGSYKQLNDIGAYMVGGDPEEKEQDTETSEDYTDE